jgi:hypothetical protein
MDWLALRDWELERACEIEAEWCEADADWLCVRMDMVLEWVRGLDFEWWLFECERLRVWGLFVPERVWCERERLREWADAEADTLSWEAEWLSEWCDLESEALWWLADCDCEP